MSLQLSSDRLSSLYTMSRQCLLELADDIGIAASSRTEAYGCLFGRDSAITVLKILNWCERHPDQELLAIARTTLCTHTLLQGKAYNIESGEQPGKYIHEYRTSNYERLVNRPKPWYVYPDGILRNYDSIDSTPLLLIAMHRYWQLTKDRDFLLTIMNGVKAGLEWLMQDADCDGDGLVEFSLPQDRVSGGLVVQSWTDSREYLTDENGIFPDYPIAAVEVQAMSWLALRVWSDFYLSTRPEFALQLKTHAQKLRHRFNEAFIFEDVQGVYLAQALDAQKRQLKTVTGNPLFCLWATLAGSSTREAIIDDALVAPLIARAFRDDLFDLRAGIRTMSTLSPTYNPGPSSYHNGSFWPMQSSMILEGLRHWGMEEEAERLKYALLQPILAMDVPIELCTIDEDGNYQEYVSASGKKGCRYQAWTAAAILDAIAPEYTPDFRNVPFTEPVSPASLQEVLVEVEGQPAFL